MQDQPTSQPPQELMENYRSTLGTDIAKTPMSVLQGDSMETCTNDLEIINKSDGENTSNHDYNPNDQLNISSSMPPMSQPMLPMQPYTELIQAKKSISAPPSSSTLTTFTNQLSTLPETTEKETNERKQMESDGKRKADSLIIETIGITNSTSPSAYPITATISTPMNAKRRKSSSSSTINNMIFDGGDRNDDDVHNNNNNNNNNNVGDDNIPHYLGNSALHALFVDTSEINMYCNADCMNSIYTASVPEACKISNEFNPPTSKTTTTTLHVNAERDLENNNKCSESIHSIPERTNPPASKTPIYVNGERDVHNNSNNNSSSTTTTTTCAYSWTKEDDVRLTEIMKKYKNPGNWESIAKELGGGVTPRECNERWVRYLKPSICGRKGKWQYHEDSIIIEVVTTSTEQPFKKWSDLALRLPGRAAKQIRERWVNSLNPSISHLPFTTEDDLKLWHGHQNLGARWSEISRKYFQSSRSESQLKGRYKSKGFASFKESISNTPHVPNPLASKTPPNVNNVNNDNNVNNVKTERNVNSVPKTFNPVTSRTPLHLSAEKDILNDSVFAKSKPKTSTPLNPSIPKSPPHMNVNVNVNVNVNGKTNVHRKKKVAKSTPKAHKKPKSSSASKVPLYLDAETSLPNGWRVEIKKRMDSPSHGKKFVDRYWYSPHHKYKLRSRTNVKKYLDAYALEEFNIYEEGSKEKESAVWDRVFSKSKKCV